MSDLSDLELLRELGVDVKPEKAKTYTSLEARLIAGFEDILKFAQEHGHTPQHGEARDIFERLYAVRLDQLRKNPQALILLADMDLNGLLAKEHTPEVKELDDKELLSQLGVDTVAANNSDITVLKHVAPVAHRQAAEQIANREVCRDFEQFDEMFSKIRTELKNGLRVANNKKTYGDIEIGQFYILRGQMAFIADKYEKKKATGNNGDDYRLRVIFDNGTESGLLMSSLQRSFYEKENKARIISDLNQGPLFAENTENETGAIYVLRSKSNLPEIAPIRDVILKIGVTGGSVKTRISNAKNEATYLLGEVEVIDEYTLYNISRKKLETMIHRIFSDAQLQILIKDRFGKPFTPREWFLVPPAAVAEAVDLIQSGEITNYRYDRSSASFQKI